MNIGVITQNYPSTDNLYNSSFVHTRVRGYIRKGHKVRVYRIADKGKDYTFEGVQVYMGNEEHIRQKMLAEKTETISIHMPNMREINFVKTVDIKNVLLFFHGSESVWSCKLYPYEGNFLSRIIKYIYRYSIDIKKRGILGGYIREYRPKLVHIGHVWRHRTNEFLPIEDIPYYIIPNPIENSIFKYSQRKGTIKNIICVRPHSTSKYALDIIIKLFSKSKYQVHIYGAGKLLEEHKRLAKKYNSNVKFITEFQNHKQLNKLYHQYNLGIMLTRLDAQGVSACEMMGTGLPIITSDIEGNSEFTEKGCIRIPNSTDVDIDAIIDKINNKKSIMKLSKEAYEYIDGKLNTDKIISEDIALMKKKC